MFVKKVCFVALALSLTPSLGCRKKSNTTEQDQSNTTGAPAGGATTGVGSDTNPHAPNPSGAVPGTPMGPASAGPGVGAASDAGVDGGAGAAGGGSAAAAGGGGAGGAAGAGSAGSTK
jgi:hypothetical protein